jgi:hypothetical protein
MLVAGDAGSCNPPPERLLGNVVTDALSTLFAAGAG